MPQGTRQRHPGEVPPRVTRRGGASGASLLHYVGYTLFGQDWQGFMHESVLACP